MEFPDYSLEEQAKSLGYKYIVGTDEAGRGCERPDAEVLTHSGWKFYEDILETDKVLSFTKEGELVWQPISFVVEKKFNGELIELKNRSINICVTPDHYFDVLRRTFKRDEDYRLRMTGYTYGSRVLVSELKNNNFIPRGGMWVGKNVRMFTLPETNKKKYDSTGKNYSKKHIPMDLWLKFLGIYLAEGSATHSKNGSYVVSIKQVKKDNLDLIYETLVRLPFEVFKEKERVVIRNKQLYDYVVKLGKSFTKYIPTDFKELNNEYLNILVDWLVLGDGSEYIGHNRKKVRVYYTTSKKLRDDFEEIVLKIGKSYKTVVRQPRDSFINNCLIKKENCKPCYEIRIRQNNKASVKGLHKKNIPYEGKVFCLGLQKHHNFYVRRAGSGYFTGNCGAGPVVAAAVHIPEEALPELIGKVNDSKKMTPKRREALFEVIMDLCSAGVQDIGPEAIDNINILEATKVAMASAVEQLEYYDYVLVDGTVDLTKKLVHIPAQQVIRGDAKSISIAAASIVAKVTRDNTMVSLHKIYPQYNFLKNKGYLTAEHIEAIKLYGPTDVHRLTFNKVKDFL